MYEVLNGVKVVELGSFVFVPLAAAVLGDWGAEVIKVEPPVTGDQYRGLVTAGMTNTLDGISLSFQYANRGKRSIVLDLTKERGRELLGEVLAGADVFMTNLRPAVRARLGLDVDDLRAYNPDLIYVRGSGYGQHGALAETAALDGTAYWARGGVAAALTPEDREWPISQRPAFGDVMAAMTLAGGVAGALYRKAALGEPSVVDVSLLNIGMWQMQRDILSAPYDDGGKGSWDVPRTGRNALTCKYRTQDGRFLALAIVNPDGYWVELCTAIGRPDLVTDPRFATPAARREHNAECVAVLDEEFGSQPIAHWTKALEHFSGAWAPFQVPGDLHHDEQARVNGYFTTIDAEGRDLDVVSSPVTFDDLGDGRRMPGAPDMGQHTEEVLLELGHTWEELIELKDAGVIN
jgi:crotonobetainyl-CoA:carnitine CoA-transferase CaiB-like acyl-CoA transferase